VRRAFSAYKVAHNLLLAHGLGVQAMRGIGTFTVGIANAFWPNYPATDSPKDARAAAFADAFGMRLFMDPVYCGKYPDLLEKQVRCQNGSNIRPGDMTIIASPIDFIGVNHYSRNMVKHSLLPLYPFKNVPASYDGVRFTDMGWEIYPQAFKDLLLWIKNEYRNPAVFITENGCAMKDVPENGQVHDVRRIEYLKEYIAAMHSAMDEGANVKGYFAWSFMDNFEWAYGYEKTFGLVHVDYATQKRTVKDSGAWYSGVIRENGCQ